MLSQFLTYSLVGHTAQSFLEDAVAGVPKQFVKPLELFLQLRLVLGRYLRRPVSKTTYQAPRLHAADSRSVASRRFREGTGIAGPARTQL